MGKISADNVLFTLGMFTIVMVAYGQSIASADIQSSMNIIFANWPTFGQIVSSSTGPQRSCGSLDFGCQASAGVAQATGYLAAVISYPTILFSSILNRINAIGNVFTIELFGTSAGFGSIGIFGILFFLALALVVVIEAFRLFRGSPTGL